MNHEHFNRMKNDNGFIAALDQSGGSTPKALAAYGIDESAFATEEEMFDLVHQMRTRIMTSPAFTSEKILGSILFEQTMDRQVEGQYTADYLSDKGIVPFVKIDQGLEDEKNGVQLMKGLTNIESILERAVERKIFGTKMRSNILAYDELGIRAVVTQQFDIAYRVMEEGLVPIVEPEVNIHAADKDKIEILLKTELLKHLNDLKEDQFVILKLTIPTTKNAYQELVDHPQVLRLVALSGGYETADANKRLKEHQGIVASFSRALSQDLKADQSDEEFKEKLSQAIDSIYDASVTKV